MIHIRRIEPHEWLIARRLIYRVAHTIFNERRALDEMIAHYDARGALDDMHDIQRDYCENDGLFLVTTRDGEIIGTGAIRPLEGDTCELKRLWLLTEYHGQGLGYRMMQELLAFARAKGYTRVRLETDPVAQRRAVEFYQRLGFREIPIPNRTPEEDILMELEL